MGFTLPCCWPGWDFSCRTTALSPMWTIYTINTQVGLQQHFPSTQKPGITWRCFQRSQTLPFPIICLSTGTSIVFDMSLTYILVALVAVILNNALVELLSLHTRISVGEWGSLCPSAQPRTVPPIPHLHLPPAGYLFALGPLLFVSICDVWLELFSRRQAYAINLVAVGVVAFGCTGMWDTGGAGGSTALQAAVGEQPHPQEPWSPGTL